MSASKDNGCSEEKRLEGLLLLFLQEQRRNRAFIFYLTLYPAMAQYSFEINSKN